MDLSDKQFDEVLNNERSMHIPSISTFPSESWFVTGLKGNNVCFPEPNRLAPDVVMRNGPALLLLVRSPRVPPPPPPPPPFRCPARACSRLSPSSRSPLALVFFRFCFFFFLGFTSASE